MPRGTVEAIHIAPSGGAPMKTVKEANAVAGRGLEGDRYFLKNGTYSKPGDEKPQRQLTLIEAEAVEAAGRDYEVPAPSSDIRRNVVTRGVALNHLVGKEFKVGAARLRGIKLCEPCDHMESLAGKKGIRAALVHRGGLNAEVLTTGTVRVGDAVEWSD